jgi:hypothetical protein
LVLYFLMSAFVGYGQTTRPAWTRTRWKKSPRLSIYCNPFKLLNELSSIACARMNMGPLAFFQCGAVSFFIPISLSQSVSKVSAYPGDCRRTNDSPVLPLAVLSIHRAAPLHARPSQSSISGTSEADHYKKQSIARVVGSSMFSEASKLSF